MKVNKLYRYKRNDGGITVSPDKPDRNYTELFRVIADEGKSITKDGKMLCSSIDTDKVEGWYEVDNEETE